MTPNRTQKHVAQWVTRVLLTLGESKALLKLYIHDPGDFGRRDFLRDYILDTSRPSDQVALEIEHDAQQEANGTGSGPHHFRLQALRDGENKHFNATSFILASEHEDDDAHPEADAKTLLAQSQRHLEAMAKISMQERASMAQGFHTITQGLAEQLAAYQAMQLQILQLAQANTVDRAKLDFDLETRKALLELAKGIAIIAGPMVIPKMIAKWMPEPESSPEAPAQVAGPEQTVLPTAIPASIPALESAPANGASTKRRKREPS